MEDEIRTYIEPICRQEQVHLIDSAVHGSGPGRIIRVIVDTDRGITLNQCEDLSRKFSDIFFRKNLFGGNYRLEVSSPGIEKSLDADYEFIRNIGRDLKLEYISENESKSVTGTLKAYENGILMIETPGGPVNISRNKLKKANVKLKW
jgi:ribosome maturation factor RimP